MGNPIMLIVAATIMFGFFGVITVVTYVYNLNSIKSKTVGDGQHGTARFATSSEMNKKFKYLPYQPSTWRKKAKETDLKLPQGVVLGLKKKKGIDYAIVDDDDVHTMMIGAAGCGKTAYWLYPNLEYACASGMSFLTTDTKGDLYRNYGNIAKKYYGYDISILDLRNPTKSDGNNLLYLVNKYIDKYKADESDISSKAKAEKYAKIISKTLIFNEGDSSSYGQNAFFYDAAEGLMTSAILLVAEFAPPEERHIVSVFKLIQDLSASTGSKGKKKYHELMEKLPPDHKIRWFAGAALNASDQSMSSVMSTAMTRLNAFLDSELEQILCFDTAIDAEKFCSQKCAVFIVLPEENPATYFMVSLLLQQFYREILSVADERGGQLEDRVIFYMDEFGTLPTISSAEMMYSASRSRKLSLVSIIQSYKQLEKNYGSEGADIIKDNCQVTIAGGFAPTSSTAEAISNALGTRTVMTGSVSRSKNDPTQNLQMTDRPLMTPDELRSMKKGNFIVMKTGCHPFISKLKLFFKWGIDFDAGTYEVKDNGTREVKYTSEEKIKNAVIKKYPPEEKPQKHSAKANENETLSLEEAQILDREAEQQFKDANSFEYELTQEKEPSKRTGNNIRIVESGGE